QGRPLAVEPVSGLLRPSHRLTPLLDEPFRGPGRTFPFDIVAGQMEVLAELLPFERRDDSCVHGGADDRSTDRARNASDDASDGRASNSTGDAKGERGYRRRLTLVRATDVHGAMALRDPLQRDL